MSFKALLQEIQDNQIGLSLNDDGNLDISLSKALLADAELIERIKANKSKLKASLQESLASAQLAKSKITPFQEGLVSFVKAHEDSNRYIIQLTYETTKSLSFQGIYQACNQVVQRHDILRATFDFDVNENIFRTRLLPDNCLNCKSILPAEEEIYRHEHFKISEEPLIKFALLGNNKLIITMHHLIIDVNSIHILLDELFYFYESQDANTSVSRLEKPVQFSKYVEWILNQDKLQAMNYWRNLLKDYKPTLLENVAVKTSNMVNTAYQEARFNFTLTEATKGFIQNNRLTLPEVLNFLTGFVLSKYYGDGQFVWGNTMTHRYANGMTFVDMVGPCISTVPVAFDFSIDQTLADALNLFHEQLMASREHSYLSLNEIYGAVKSENLFSALFSFQDMTASSRLATIDNGIKRVGNENEVSSHFPFAILVTQLEGRLDFNVNYRKDLFPEDMAKGAIELIMFILNDLSALSRRSLKAINLFEEAAFISLGQITGDDVLLSENGLLAMFNKSVQHFPERVAVEDYSGNSLTYEELDSKSNYIANRLLADNIKGAVGLYLNYTSNIVVSVLGILKAGCHFVSLEQGFPMEKLLWLAAEAQLKACIIEDITLLSQQLPTDCLTIKLDEVIPPAELIDILPVPALDDLCALYYTSGSTGVPKVVKTSHGNTLNGLSWLAGNFPARSNDIFCLNIRFSFSPALRNVFEALSQGAKLLIIPEFLYHDVDKFSAFVSEKNISRISLTPSFIKVLIENKKMSLLQNITLLEIRGEAVRMSDIKAIKRELPDAVLLNRYGATEASSTSYNWSYDSDILEYYPLGKPVLNTTISIVDNQLQIKPRNIVGEIMIESKSLSLGYLNEQDNNGVFINRTDEGGNRQFKTGDYGFIDSAGVLQYIGRKNRMIKVRGFRIEPSEIEFNLELFTGVEKAVVISLETTYGVRLVAFCLVKNKSEFSEINLKHFLRDKMPAYMVPGKIMLLEELPRTSTGKVDLMTLQKLVLDESSRQLRLPFTVTEKRLYQIFIRLMPESPISVEEDFYSMGVDSILIMRANYEVEREFNIKLKGAEMFEFDTISKLAEYLDRIMEDNNYQRKENFHSLNFVDTNKDILFLIPPLTGNSTFRMLQPFVPADLDFVVFDTIEPEEYDTLGKDMETLASYYKNIILNIAKDKKVHLAGWSFGASLCFEVAVQLSVIGYEVPSLILLDPTFYNPEFDSDHKEREDYLKILSGLLIEGGIDPKDFDTSKIIEQMYKANQVSKKYRLKPYRGDIFLIKPEIVASYERNYNIPYNGLDEFCTGKISVSMVKGNHLTMTTGPAKFFAEAIFSKIVR